MKRLLILASFMLVFFTSCITIKIQPFGNISTSTKRTKIANNSVLHIRLSGDLQMYSPIDDGFTFLTGHSDNAHDLILKIRAAKDDKRITAIILQPRGINAGYTTLNELKAALIYFKSSGKKVYGYFDVASDPDMFLLSVADEVYMNPSASAGFVLSGVGGNIMFMKDLLDKLGAEVHIIRAGDYKSAGEPFTRTEMSEEMRENYSELYSDFYEQLLSDFAKGYSLSLDDIRYLFEEREKFIINLQDAISMGIINELMFFDNMLNKLNINENQLVSQARYAIPRLKPQRNNIAVVYMLGDIVSQSGSFNSSNNITSSEYVKIFDKIIANDNIKAVVIRVSSGGGSALESEIIHAKISQLSKRKPVIVSMGGAAASGGYYIVSNANYIFADPYTITGSIGVFLMLFNLQETAEKIGINFEPLRYGKFANAGNPFMPFNSEFADALQISTNDIYTEFKTRVAEGRNMSIDEVEAIAKGQIWSATKALQHNLIDEIGLLDNAINKAVEMTSLDNYSLMYFPEKRSFFSSFFTGFNTSISQMLPTMKLPDPINKNVDYYLNLFEDIILHPIQMRSEFFLDVD
ncbi:MAG: signal peptide peptidase SppA [Candidatus Cloacimonetes bacterium]|nr:signal peptide peptidase SppA [Candidatus Cloacimonadota bacterium]